MKKLKDENKKKEENSNEVKRRLKIKEGGGTCKNQE